MASKAFPVGIILISLFAWVRSIYATLRISAGTLWDTFFKSDIRAPSDRRLAWWSKKLLHYAGLSYSVTLPKDFKMKEGEPYVLMSNHTSHYDIPLVFVALPGVSVRMLTKKELFKTPIWGRAMTASEFISIDRKNQRQALKDLNSAREKMESGIAVWVAPEGTRSRTGELGSFKRGGFKLAIDVDATIIPIGISGANKALPAGTWKLNRGQTAEIVVGKPIKMTAAYKNDVKSLIEKVRSTISKLAGV